MEVGPRGLARAPGAGARRDPRRRPRRRAGRRPGRHRRRLDRRDRADPAHAARWSSTPSPSCCRCCCPTPRSRSGGRPTRPTDPAADPLGALAQRRITDAAAVTRGKAQAHAHASARPTRPGNTDLAWTRLTPVAGAAGRRARPAPAQGHRRPSVTAERISPSADLLVAWLADRLKVRRRPQELRGARASPRSCSRPRRARSGSRRPDGRLATFSSPGQPDRPIALQAPRAPRAARRGAAPARRGRRLRRTCAQDADQEQVA